MGHLKKTKSRETDIISASEIGQYQYCPMAWYLQRCGYKPDSQFLDAGIRKHVELGETVDYIRVNSKRAKVLSYLGYLLLLITFLIVLFEVII